MALKFLWLRSRCAVSSAHAATWRCYHTRECFGHREALKEVTTAKPKAVGSDVDIRLNLLASAYRNHGHLKASLDPLAMSAPSSATPPQLSPQALGLLHQTGSENGFDNSSGVLFGLPHGRVSESDAVQYLERMYCGDLTMEVSQSSSCEEREWLFERYERERCRPLPDERRRDLAELLLRCQTFDQFLAKKFTTLKRYGAEGAESIMAFFSELFLQASKAAVSDVVVGAQHRGRLNILADVFNVSPTAIFSKVQGNAEFPEGAPSTGDVVSHMFTSVDVGLADGSTVHASFLPNPSHLESVSAVATGKARARQLSHRITPYTPHPPSPPSHPHSHTNKKVLSVALHGDASFSAQGVVMELLAMSNLPHYGVGGTLHLVVNNQLGFTTQEELGRSSRYCSDVGKMIGCPVLHVNGDHPEEVVRATVVAMDYLNHFEKDVIIDMLCYRRWGHNELDNPSLTQPLMYDVIANRSSVPDKYRDSLVSSGVTGADSLSAVPEAYFEHLNQCLKETSTYTPQATHLKDRWEEIESATNQITVWDTGCPADLLRYVGAKSVSFPEELTVNARLVRSHVEERVKRLEQGAGLDWATAEALAIGSLLYQGFNVRLSGQDVGRGTFSHRHAMMVCQETDQAYVPLNHIADGQRGFLEVANSPLSEEAVLGFEYGFSIESPHNLVLWEAQFGDFFNGAQIMIDTCVSSGEAKWLLQSGLVMLLPHGYDGAGPEHSSCRVERFLQLCSSQESVPDGDDVNMHLAHPTTSAQYFHLLRRQMVRNFRKPLIIQSPKILLRYPAAASALSEMEPGTSFQPVLPDPSADPSKVTRVVLCSGKHYYALDAYRKDNNISDTALVRLELLCPFPSAYIHQQLSQYPKAKEFVWSQEEHENMGPWSFVEPRFRRQLGTQLRYAGREAAAAPAVGVAKMHLAEEQKLLKNTFVALA